MKSQRRNTLRETPDGIVKLLAEDCIVTRALERYLYQVLEFVYTDMIAPRDAQIIKLEARVKELEGQCQ